MLGWQTWVTYLYYTIACLDYNLGQVKWEQKLRRVSWAFSKKPIRNTQRRQDCSIRVKLQPKWESGSREEVSCDITTITIIIWGLIEAHTLSMPCSPRLHGYAILPHGHAFTPRLVILSYFGKKESIFYCFYCLGEHVRCFIFVLIVCLWGQRTVCQSRFSPPTVWVCRVKLRPAGLAARAFLHWTSLPALVCFWDKVLLCSPD